jgi:hypothetical protein
MNLTKPLAAEQEIAASLTAQGRSAQAIADELKVCRKTVERWRQVPQFRARVLDFQKAFYESIRQKGAAVMELRVQARQRRLAALYRIVRTRKGKEECGAAAWDDTGYMLRRDKMLGSGELATLTTEFELDTGILSAMFDLEEGIAVDMGQRRHKIDVNTPEKPAILPAALELAKQLTPEEIQERLQKLDGLIEELSRQPRIVDVPSQA